MHPILYISTLASLLLSSATAAPVREDVAQYKWRVTKFQFSRGQLGYDYNFTITAPSSDTAPGFKASCSGAAQRGFHACDNLLVTIEQAATPVVSAKVKIVQDPKNPNDNIPRVVVRETWRGGEGCEYSLAGGYDKRGFNQPVGSDRGSKFAIVPGREKVAC